MYNDIKYNVILCPNRFDDNTYHGCTIPGTSNGQADTSLNQAGIYSRAITNNLIGNRVANAFNGMFFDANGMDGEVPLAKFVNPMPNWPESRAILGTETAVLVSFNTGSLLVAVPRVLMYYRSTYILSSLNRYVHFGW